MKAMKANIARKATVHKGRPKKKVEKKAPTSMKLTEETWKHWESMKAKVLARTASTSATPGMTEIKATTGKSMHATSTTSTSAAGRKEVHVTMAPTTSLSPNSEQLVTKLYIDSLRQDRQILKLIGQVKEHGRLIGGLMTKGIVVCSSAPESAESACDD